MNSPLRFLILLLSIFVIAQRSPAPIVEEKPTPAPQQPAKPKPKHSTNSSESGSARRSPGSDALIDSTPDGVEFDLVDADGKHHSGKTPETVSSLPAGLTKVRFKRAGATDQTREFRLLPNQYATQAFNLSEKAHSPTSPSQASNNTFAGTWTGTVRATCPPGGGPSASVSSSDYTIRVSSNEKTVSTTWAGLRIPPAHETSCSRHGNTLSWNFGEEWQRSTCSLTLKGRNSATFKRTFGPKGVPPKCEDVGLLSR
jgi:hypothetical protein